MGVVFVQEYSSVLSVVVIVSVLSVVVVICFLSVKNPDISNFVVWTAYIYYTQLLPNQK